MNITPISDSALLGPLQYYTDWSEPPDIGPLASLPQNVGQSLAHWSYEEATIEIDIAGPPATISRCVSGMFDGNLRNREAVLLGENLAGRLPVHLFLRTPVKGIGAAVSAAGPSGRDYLAQCSVRTDDGLWWAVPPRTGRLNQRRNSAPFLGANARRGSRITEIWFDVVDPANQVDFSSVVIGSLYFVPAH